jgi:hypothetical protein
VRSVCDMIFDMEGLKIEKESGIQFKEYYQKANMVILAEAVGHGKHSEEIEAFLDKFHSQLNGLFIETPINHQKSYDRYFETGEIDSCLEETFEGALKEGKDLRASTLTLLDKVKQYGLVLICYDASKRQTETYSKRAKHGYYFIKGECRDEDMFTNVRDYYHDYPGKYVVLVGSNHIAGHNFGGNYPNFGERMKQEFGEQCTAIKMTNSDQGTESIYDDVVIKK